MLYPKFISKGDVIGVGAPSDGKIDKIDLVRLDNAYDKLKNVGFGIVESNNVRCSDKGRSATGKDRARYLEELFFDDDVDMIISCSGGDFLVEILPYIDFDVIRNNPKWFCGYSDNTGIGFVITTCLDIASMYSDNISCFGMNDWDKSVNNYLEILKGNVIEQSSFEKYQANYLEYKTGLESYNLDTLVYWKNLIGGKEINLRGRFIGGCLDVLLCLIGTKYDKVEEFVYKYRNDGIVWFLESCELSSEQIIRGLWQLKEASWFKYTKGFIFGRTIMKKSYYDIDYEVAIEDSLMDLGVPVIIDADFGHTAPRMTLINGCYVEINSNNGKGNIKMILK
jgi:muramoyltetrapeptide carboxypeptidase LdcA involved in peptidoglycan recycling